MKGSEELRLTRPEGLVETWGKWTLTVAKGDRESSPSLERQKVLSQEDQGPPETCISECEIWAYKVPKRSVGTRDHLIEAHPIPFRGMVLLRKCLESHHSSKT